MHDSNLEYLILDQISQLNTPVGASFLCSKIDSSQASIGRALYELECRGLLEKISNKGRVLTEEGKAYFQLLQQNADSRECVDVLLDLFSKNDKHVYLNILEARILLEVKTAELAAKNATEQDIQDIEKILMKHQKIRLLGKPAENENLEFHYKIAQIANNPVIYHLLRLVMTQHSAYLHFSFMDYTLVGSTLFHAQIFDAIKAHDSEKASALMYDHLHALVTTLQNIEYDKFVSILSNKHDKEFHS